MSALGAGNVTINGRSEKWDRVDLLDAGVLHVAKVETWIDRATGVRCTTELQVQYCGPGTWSTFEPDVPTNGTLILTVDGYAPEVLAARVTESEAIQIAADHLTSTYRGADWTSSRIVEFFRDHSHQLSIGNTSESPRFRFVLLPRPGAS